MATRSVLARLDSVGMVSYPVRGFTGGVIRYFSDDKGRILSEEERAAENVYIQKMEREKREKMKKKADREKAELEKHSTDKVHKS